jgi:purine-binding chemotaxis protein CheW
MSTNEPKYTHTNYDQVREEDNIDNKYLLFRLGDELYGTPLLGVREVVEPQASKPIPNTPKHFSGVINIRGEIVGVIDLRMRFNHKAEVNPHQALMVFSTDGGPMAGLVDKVESVISLTDKEIEHNPNVGIDVSRDALIGIGKHSKRLITLIDLHKVLQAHSLDGKKLTA